MIEFCGNCQTGADTKDQHPGTCPFYQKARGKHCASHMQMKHRPTDGRMVYIASPLRGDIENNLRKASAYCRAAMEAGAVPIAPHLYFASYLDDTKPSERRTGMEMGLHMLRRCDELWVFGAPSEGMQREIEFANAIEIPVLYIPEATINEILNSVAV